MVNDFNLTDTHHFLPSLGDLELLEILLSAEDTTYPWDIADTQTEVYLQKMEQQIIQQDFLPLTEITQREANFFRHLDMIWEKIPDNNPEIYPQHLVDYLLTALNQVFAPSVPLHWLHTITQKAIQVFTLERSASEKLVECVQSLLPLLPNLETVDLLVLARPIAYNIRTKEIDDLDISSLSSEQKLTPVIELLVQQQWSDLSEVDQAKIGLIMADFALKKLDHMQSEFSK